MKAQQILNEYFAEKQRYNQRKEEYKSETPSTLETPIIELHNTLRKKESKLERIHKENLDYFENELTNEDITEYLTSKGFERINSVGWKNDIFGTWRRNLRDNPTYIKEESSGSCFIYRIKPNPDKTMYEKRHSLKKFTKYNNLRGILDLDSGLIEFYELFLGIGPVGGGITGAITEFSFSSIFGGIGAGPFLGIFYHTFRELLKSSNLNKLNYEFLMKTNHKLSSLISLEKNLSKSSP